MKPERLLLTGVAERPDWWCGRPNEITEISNGAVAGESRVIAMTPLGFPVWSVTYGERERQPNRVNWSIVSASSHPELYGSLPGEKQTVMIAAGIHGCEVEGVVTVLNLITLLETGFDLRGERRPELVELCRRYRLILLPCVNMDGRAISPDHRLDSDYQECRYAGVGAFKNGEPVFPRQKEFYPLPLEEVSYPGGYPNSEGYNIMHDATPGNLRTAEAAALLKLADEEQIDLLVNLHSQPERKTPFITPGSLIGAPEHNRRRLEFRKKIAEKLASLGYDQSHFNPEPVRRASVNLDTMAEMATGALTLTYEYAARYADSFDAVLESGYLLLEMLLEEGLQTPFADRRKVVGMT